MWYRKKDTYARCMPIFQGKNRANKYFRPFFSGGVKSYGAFARGPIVVKCKTMLYEITLQLMLQISSLHSVQVIEDTST